MATNPSLSHIGRSQLHQLIDLAVDVTDDQGADTRIEVRCADVLAIAEFVDAVLGHTVDQPSLTLDSRARAAVRYLREAVKYGHVEFGT